MKYKCYELESVTSIWNNFDFLCNDPKINRDVTSFINKRSLEKCQISIIRLYLIFMMILKYCDVIIPNDDQILNFYLWKSNLNYVNIIF